MLKKITLKSLNFQLLGQWFLTCFVLLALSGCSDDNNNIVTGGDGDCTKQDIINGDTDNCLVLESTSNLVTDDIFATFQESPQGLQVGITAQDFENQDSSAVFFMYLFRTSVSMSDVITTGNGPIIELPDGTEAHEWILTIQYGDFEAGTVIDGTEIKPIGEGSITIHEFTKTRFRATINESFLERGLGGDLISVGGEIVITK